MNLSFETIQPNIRQTTLDCFEEKSYEPRIYKILGPSKTGKTILAKKLLERLNLNQGIAIVNQNCVEDYKFQCFEVEDKEQVSQVQKYVDDLPMDSAPNFVLFDVWTGGVCRINCELLFDNYRRTNTSIVIVSRDWDESFETDDTGFPFVDYTMICSNHEETNMEDLGRVLPRVKGEDIRKLLDFCTMKKGMALKVNHAQPTLQKFEMLSFLE